MRAPSQRVHALGQVALEQGLSVHELTSSRSQLMLASGVRDVRAAEWRELAGWVAYVASRQPGAVQCRACRAWVFWGATSKGRNMPVDPMPHPQGTVTVERTPAGGVRLTVHSLRSLPLPPPVYRSHFATCPHAGQQRAARLTPDAGPSEPTCTICGYRLAPCLVARGETTHGEDPSEAARW